MTVFQNAMGHAATRPSIAALSRVDLRPHGFVDLRTPLRPWTAETMTGQETDTSRVETALAAAFCGGDETALEAAYAAHGSLIYTMCHRANPAQAADLTQEVFLAAWRARERFDPARGPLPGWLVGIAKNKIIDSFRKQGRTLHTTPLKDGLAIERATNTSNNVEEIADKLLITEALGQLSDRARKVVELAYFGDQTHEQIALATDIPLGTVKSDIRRGLATLRQHLEVAT